MTQKYSDLYPKEEEHSKAFGLGLATAIMAAASIACLFTCLKLYGNIAWAGYAMLGIALAWVLFILPFWFDKWIPLIFLPIDFASVCGYLLYVNAKSGGHWFLSFAFPVTMIMGVIVLAATALYRYVKKGRLFITGGLLLTIGGSAMLIEFFQSITFGSEMFVWSLYCVSFFALLGIFLIVAALIPPLRAYLEKKFFY